MGRAVQLGKDYDGDVLRRLASDPLQRGRAGRPEEPLVFGPEPKVTAEHRKALAEWVERGPIPAIHGVVRWRRCDLAQDLHEEFGVSVDESTVGRALREMGYAKISAHPRHHAQNEYVVEAFKKTSPPNWRKSRRGLVRA